MLVYSPIIGLLLEHTSIADVYQDFIYHMEYIINNNVVTRISSSISGGELIRNKSVYWPNIFI